MFDKKIEYPDNNIRGLVQDLSEKLDAMADELRRQTVFADTRPADAKTFMLISRHPRGLTELAKALGISRQAAHMSVQRLVNVGVVSFDYADGSKRDMIARLTESGQEARKVGLAIAASIDEHIVKQVGKEDAETLRRILMELTQKAIG